MAEPRYEIRIFWSPEDRLYLAQVPDLPGCITDGNSYEEALANARVVIGLWLEVAREHGDPIPRPRRVRDAVA